MAQPSDKDDFVSLESFSVTQFLLHLRNLTSGVDLPESDLLRIAEILDHGFVIEIPQKTCSKGHHLEIEIFQIKTEFRQSPQRQSILKATAKITDTEEVDSKLIRATLEIKQVAQDEWASFLSRFSAMQEKVTQFLAQTKG